MRMLAFLIGLSWGAVLAWGMCYWCTSRRTAAARFVRQTLNLGGPEGGGNGPP